MLRILTILVACLLLFISYQTDAQRKTEQNRLPIPEEMLFNSAQGREFWLAIPPNEADGQPIGNTNDISIDFYVTSSVATEVTLEIPGLGYSVTKKVEPYKITQFTTWGGETSFGWELRESEKILDMGIHVFAKQPISVYVLNHRHYSADGYLAIPTSAWGREYIHLSYYDFHEDLYGGESRGGGFIITAAEDNTKITINLKGVGDKVGKTLGGQTIPKVYSITLHRGQLYVVMGDGLTRGQFDLSGSKIVANKPVGFISFHKRTLIPSFDLYNGRNMLVEMIPPTSAWGKQYATVEFARKGRGDFFRVICKEDNTTFHIKWYDIGDGRLVGQQGPITLKKSGDFYEYLETFVPQGMPNVMESIKGTSTFEADKPILVMQYSYSTDWDNAPEFDPFMILVVPVEQFVPGTVFQTPEKESQFLTNWFNIVAIGDSTDPGQEKLRSLKLDDKEIVKIDPMFVYNKIPGTNLYWSKIRVDPGVHRVTGDTRFGGYIYGFSDADGYGWPAAMAINKIDEVDTLPPVLIKIGECGSYIYTATEYRNGQLDDNPRQIDQGVASVELIEGSYNYELKITRPNPFITYPPVYEVEFTLNLIDKSKDGFAKFIVTDLYGNFTIDSVSFEAVNLSISPAELNFGNVRLNSTKTMTAVLKNESDSIVTIEGIKLKNGSVFQIISGGAPPQFVLGAGETHDIEIAYTPTTESIAETIRDKDSIEIITECDTNSWYLHGRGVIPKIMVEDWDAGAVLIGSRICKDYQTGTGLKITNTGTDTLLITNIKGIVAPFELSVPYTPTLPFKIAPKTDIWLISPCFVCSDSSLHSIDVTFESDAGSGDSISNWRGRGILPGPYVTPWDFGHLRVNSLREGKVYLRNQGNTAITVVGLKLRAGNLGFSIKPGSIFPEPTPGTPVELNPENAGSGIVEIELTVVYNPQSEGNFTDDVVAVFDEDENIPDGSIYNWVKGSAFLPKITLVGYEFLTPVLVGNTSTVQGNITIYSTSTSADLYVQEIRWKNPAQNEFELVTPPPSDFVIPMGDSIKLPVIFHPTTQGKKVEPIQVVNDAAPAIDSIIVTEADVIGWTYMQGVQATDIDYGNIITCDTRMLSSTVSNTGDSDILIDSIEYWSGDIGNFVLTNTTFPIDIPSGESREIFFVFYPNKTGLSTAEIKIHTNIEEDPIITLTGGGFEANLELSMTRYNASDKLAPGFIIKPQISMELDLPQEAQITDVQFDIVYNSDWMMYDNKIEKGGALDGTWSVTASEQKVDDTFTKLTITCKGTNFINTNNGVIAIPSFFLLLSDTKEFEPTIENITVSSRDVCVNKTSNPGLVILNTCVIDLRSIVTSGVAYELFNIEPNPVTDNDLNIKYSLSFDGFTKIELVKSSGELIGVLVNEERTKGIHELVVPISSLSSGSYLIHMTTGPFKDVKKFIINR